MPSNYRKKQFARYDPEMGDQPIDMAKWMATLREYSYRPVPPPPLRPTSTIYKTPMPTKNAPDYDSDEEPNRNIGFPYGYDASLELEDSQINLLQTLPRFRGLEEEMFDQIPDSQSLHSALQPQYREFEEGLFDQISSRESEPGTPFTNPDDSEYYKNVAWGPIADHEDYSSRPFGRWVTDEYGSDHNSEKGSKPKTMNCAEGVCYDLISRGKLKKEEVQERLQRATEPGKYSLSYGERLIDVLNPPGNRGEIDYNKLQDFDLPDGTTVFANEDRPEDHVFITRKGNNYPVRSLWSSVKGDGKFSKSWLEDVMKTFQGIQENDERGEQIQPTRLGYNTAFAG